MTTVHWGGDFDGFSGCECADCRADPMERVPTMTGPNCDICRVNHTSEDHPMIPRRRGHIRCGACRNPSWSVVHQVCYGCGSTRGALGS